MLQRRAKSWREKKSRRFPEQIPGKILIIDNGDLDATENASVGKKWVKDLKRFKEPPEQCHFSDWQVPKGRRAQWPIRWAALMATS